MGVSIPALALFIISASDDAGAPPAPGASTLPRFFFSGAFAWAFFAGAFFVFAFFAAGGFDAGPELRFILENTCRPLQY